MQYGLLTFKEPVPDISRKILHIDMDAFYASIEMRDQPKLAHQPVVIAKHPKLTGGRGIVSTCNYIARQYGIHSAMPAIEAFQRCPHAVFIQGNMQYYSEVSQVIRNIFNQYTDLVEPLSLDEAYLDVTHHQLDYRGTLKLAQRIQQHILEETRLTCSIGISYNKFIAKIASDFHKPFGITLVTPQEASVFLKQLQIEDFHGVGRKSIPYFHQLGIKTGEDLLKWELDELIKHFGKMGYSLYYKVRGVHDSPVSNYRERKSIGTERTFSQFLESEGEVAAIFEQLTAKVVQKLQSKGLKAYTVTIKVRYDNFETMTRQSQMEFSVDQYEACLNVVQKLWQDHGRLDHTVRLLGVALSKFEDPKYSSIQLEF